MPTRCLIVAAGLAAGNSKLGAGVWAWLEAIASQAVAITTRDLIFGVSIGWGKLIE